MLIVVSPAKSLDYESKGLSRKFTEPEFLDDAKILNEKINAVFMIFKFENLEFKIQIFENSIKNTFKINNLDFAEDKNQIKFIASHNGYEKKFGCIHKREISLDKLNGKLIGSDEIIKKKLK